MFSEAIKEATIEIKDHAAKELELIAKQREAVEAISNAELLAGNAVLAATEGQSTAVHIDAVVRSRATLAAVSAAITTCRALRLESIKAKRLADAATLRAQAGELRVQVE